MENSMEMMYLFLCKFFKFCRHPTERNIFNNTCFIEDDALFIYFLIVNLTVSSPRFRYTEV